MAALASYIENDAFNMTKDVYNLVGTAGTVPDALLKFTQAQAKLNQYLAPTDQRSLQINSNTQATMVSALSGLFHESTQIAKQYREGMIGRVAGMDWYVNDRVYTHTTGTDHTTVTINDGSIADGDSTLTTAGGALTVGTVVTFGLAGTPVRAVHPETKVAYSHQQQFVVTTVTDANNYTFSPAFILTGPRQNINVLPVTGDAVTCVGAASTSYAQDLAYHKDAFAIAFADLVMPQGVDFASRKVYDGISMRIVRQYDINNDLFPCRIDVLYGYKTLRASQAVRITN